MWITFPAVRPGKPQGDPAAGAEDDARQGLDRVEGDRGGDSARGCHSRLLERECHPCAGDADTAWCERQRARGGEGRQSDERRSDRVVHVERLQHRGSACQPRRGRESHPRKDRRREPEAGQPPPAGDRHDEHERGEQQPARQQPEAGPGRAHQQVDDCAGAGDREAGVTAQPAALAMVDVAGEQPDPDRIAQTSREHCVRERAEPIAAPRLVGADPRAGRAQGAAPGPGGGRERNEERHAGEHDRPGVEAAELDGRARKRAAGADAGRHEHADPGEGGDRAERRRERE
jgi:hypothetical protein